TAPGASGCTVTGSPPAAHTLSTSLAAFTSARYRNTVAPSEKRAGMTTIGRDRRGALLGSSIVDPGGLEVGVLVHRMTGFVAPRSGLLDAAERHVHVVFLVAVELAR